MAGLTGPAVGADRLSGRLCPLLTKPLASAAAVVVAGVDVAAVAVAKDLVVGVAGRPFFQFPNSAGNDS